MRFAENSPEMFVIGIVSTNVACEVCAATGNMGLEMALCGAVGGVVIVKMIARDLLRLLPGRGVVNIVDIDDEDDFSEDDESEAVTARAPN